MHLNYDTEYRLWVHLLHKHYATDDHHKQTVTLDDITPHLMREFFTEIGGDLAKDAATMSWCGV